jgi:dTDP-4-dehydrorhamnose reductase
MRILIIGANGLLGSDLVKECATEEIIAAASCDVDIRDFRQVRDLIARSKPKWIVLAAAYTDVDGSERNPDLAFAVNRDGTKNVAIAAREHGAKLFYVSTDYVFDGNSARPYEPDDPIHPLNVYGASKAAGESAVLEQGGHWVIARSSWLFGASRACFPEKILAAADSQTELRVVNDQVGSPTYTRDLAEAIHKLMQANAHGILNITNSGSCSWFEFAGEILQRGGRKTPVLPITSTEAARPARRPSYSALSPAALADYGIRLRNWRDALEAYLAERGEKGKALT